MAMHTFGKVLLCGALLAAICSIVYGPRTLEAGARNQPDQAPEGAADTGLTSFNVAFRDVILRMDNAGTMALWAEDGVSLLPDAAPIAGKKSIAEFMDKVMTELAGYRVGAEDIKWKDMRVAGDWASEWGVVHQEAIPPGGKPAIEIYGRIALVLHREGGVWKIEQEMWQSGPKP
jgi:ketosteroid isomerase-like protein